MTTPFDQWCATKRQEAERLSWARLPEGFSYFAAMDEGYDLPWQRLLYPHEMRL